MSCRTKIINTSRGRRKVKVLRNGQYRFMKMTKHTRRKTRHTIRRTRKSRRSYKRHFKKKTYKRSGGDLF